LSGASQAEKAQKVCDQMEAKRALSGASKRWVSFFIFKTTVKSENTVSAIMRSFQVPLSPIFRLARLSALAWKPLSAKTILSSLH
jgi:hypothetical protein